MAMGRKLATYLAEKAMRERRQFIDPHADDPCRVCGKPVGARVSGGRRRVFCSEACRGAWNQGRVMQPARIEGDLSPGEIERRFQRAKAQIQERRRCQM